MVYRPQSPGNGMHSVEEEERALGRCLVEGLCSSVNPICYLVHFFSVVSHQEPDTTPPLTKPETTNMIEGLMMAARSYICFYSPLFVPAALVLVLQRVRPVDSALRCMPLRSPLHLICGRRSNGRRVDPGGKSLCLYIEFALRFHIHMAEAKGSRKTVLRNR